MEAKLKLKHLDMLVSDEPDYAEMMTEILGYKNTFFNKVKNFAKGFGDIHKIVSECNSLNYEELELNEKCTIVKPMVVDHICYLAMLNLRDSMSSESNESMSDYMATIIAIVCYEDNRSSRYNMSSNSFKMFKEQILNQPMKDMIALYMWVLKGIKYSDTSWNQRFFECEIQTTMQWQQE